MSGAYLTFYLFLCIGICSASLDGCSLFAGGDFIYSETNGEVTPGFIKYDISSGAFTPYGNVYKDAHVDSLFEQDGYVIHIFLVWIWPRG